jgi:hypothetical protein
MKSVIFAAFVIAFLSLAGCGVLRQIHVNCVHVNCLGTELR